MEKMTFTFFIVDDDPICIKLYENALYKEGHKVIAMSSAEYALEEIIRVQPDCIISDLVLPGLDGLQFYQQIRQEKRISKQPIFAIVTSKEYDYDHRRGLALGVNCYLNKSQGYETIIERILQIVKDQIVIHFWGVRGTLPVPGKHSVRYGGNTNCVSVEFPNNLFFIFDGGSGIKELSRYVLKQHRNPFVAKIFLTHPHWDHINGLPFFAPFYKKGNEFEIYGPSHHSATLDQLLTDQMGSVYFPVTVEELSAKISFHPLTEEDFWIEDVHIKTTLLNHPGRCLGYRMSYKNKVLCYITDNEIYFEDSPSFNQFNHNKLVQFIAYADVLIIDTTYSDKDYMAKIHWGHSCVSRVVDVAEQAHARLLCLYHHDPDQFDEDIDKKLVAAQAQLKNLESNVKCIIPCEGDKLLI